MMVFFTLCAEKLGGQESSKRISFHLWEGSDHRCISHIGCAPCLNRELYPALWAVETFRMVRPRSTVKQEEPKSREQHSLASEQGRAIARSTKWLASPLGSFTEGQKNLT